MGRKCRCKNLLPPNGCYMLLRDSSFWAEVIKLQRALEKIKTLKVVNDIAERMVKLTSDFLPLAKDEDNFQDFLQVVVKNRQGLPNLRAKKSVLSEWASSH